MSESKAAQIDRVKANLPLPEQPPVPSDWNSADARTVNVGSGGLQSDISIGAASDSLREPATADSAVRTDGEEMPKTNTAGVMDVGRSGKEGLGGLPSDALAKAKKADGVVETRGEDYGYPHKSDPSSGLK